MSQAASPAVNPHGNTDRLTERKIAVQRGLGIDGRATTAVEVLPIDITWVSWLILIGTIAVGLALRLIGIADVGFNTDEAVYAGQAAGILNDPDLRPYFPVFRAHPLLFQFVLALVYSVSGVSDVAGRATSAAFGAMTILLVFVLGRSLYGTRVGLLAALFVALMPYHIVVTRQVLLDGPMTMFATLTLCAVAQYAKTQSARWLYAGGLCLGLTFLAKETGIILLIGVYFFFVFCPSVKIQLIDLAIATLLCVALIAIFPLVITLSGVVRTGQSYLIWQLLRQPNHNWAFYAVTAVPMIGILLIIAAIASIVARWRNHTWREVLLLTWITIPVVFFQLWAVKGFQYLLPTTPALSILAAACFVKMSSHSSVTSDCSAARKMSLKSILSWRALAATVTAASLAALSLYFIMSKPNTFGLAGTGGLAGGRETGRWFAQNTPKNAQILAVGPSIANLIQFYGHRKTHMLSVSPNPLQRNPAYDHVENPNLKLRTGDLQYVVWDAYSAARSPFFSERLMGFAKKFNGRVVHTEQSDGKAVIVVYEVRP